MSFQDSTLGDDEKGFQALANKKAKENGTYTGVTKSAPIEMNSLQKGLASLLGRDHGFSTDVSSPTAPDVKAKGLTYQQKFAAGGEVQDPSDELAALLSNGGNPPPSESGLPWMQGAAQNLMNVPTPIMAPTPNAPATLPGLTAQPAPQPPVAPPAAPMAPAAPQTNPIQQASQALSSAPDTSPDIYKGISADDRLALQQKLMAQRNSPGSIFAQGLAGLGDAVNNSYGNGHSQFLKNTEENMDKRQAQTLEGVDTARQQKLQDVQGPMAAQMADPKSPIAMSMRKTLQSAGLRIPSGMPPSVMLQISGPLGELAMKQATLSVQQQQVTATQANQEAGHHLQAAKDLQDRSIVRKGWEAATGDSPETQAMRDELHATGGKAPAPTHGVPDLGSTFNGHKVLSVKRIS